MSDGKISTSLSQMWGSVVRSVTGKLPELSDEAKQTVQGLEKLVADSGIPTLASHGADRLGGYVQQGVEAVSEAVHTGTQAVGKAVEGAAEAVKDELDQALPISLNDMRVIGGNVLHLLETGQLTPEQRFILSKLTPEATASLSKLSASDIGKFLKVAGSIMLENGAKRIKAESGLLLLLVRGDLTREPAGGGKRLLDVLADRANRPLDPRLAERGMKLGESLSDVIEVTAMPMIVRQGKGSSTCVAGSLQAAKAAEDPAGYAEFALSLIQDGRATFKGPDGSLHQVPLDTTEIDHGFKGQDMIDAAIQGSLVAQARKAVPEYGAQAGVAIGDFGGGRVGGGGRFGGGRLGGSGHFGGGRLGGSSHFGGGRAGGGGRLGGEGDNGLTLPQADYLYEVALGRKGKAVNVDDRNAEAVMKRIEAIAGKEPVQVGVQSVLEDGSAGGHMLSVQGMATDPQGNPLIVISDSNVGEITAIPREEFKKMLIGALLPA